MRTTFPTYTIGIIIFIQSFLIGQWNTGGYVEMEADITPSNAFTYYGYYKLRFDLEKEINQQIEVNCSILAKQYWGQNEFLIQDYFPINPDYEFLSFTMNDTLYIDDLFLVWRTESLGEVIIGRQPISLGSAYVWNPTDIFSPKDNFDPTYELQGVTVLRWLYPIRSFELDGIIQPIQNGNDANMYLGLKGNLQHFDYTISVINRNYEYNYAQPYQYYKDTSIGFSVVGEILTAGVWFESNLVVRGDHYPDNREWAFGIDYTTPQSLYLLLETYHNDAGAGYTPGQYYPLNQVLDYLDGKTRTLCEDYIMLMSRYPLNQWWSIGAWTLRNMNDKSEIFSLQIIGSPLQDIAVDVSIFSFLGSGKTEFGIQESWIRARLNVFF
ncbi:MAG: hypothetical protein HQ510_06535 [Candidatus Marinimicrobia bacterium]|nr:hypothetical protein [Candidatus Neomarinimicrobiota bacterium]